MKTLFSTLSIASVLLLVGCADAGKSQTVPANTKVTLNASSSKTDMGGTITRYNWTQIEQSNVPQVHLFDRYTATPSFIAPNVSKETTIKFKLKTVESYNCKTEQDSSCRHHTNTDKVKVTITPSDNNSTTSTTNTSGNTSNGIYTVTAKGTITNSKKRGISGAVVTANGKTVTTQSSGKYSVSNVKTQERVVINASHPDYFGNSRVLLVNRSNVFSQNMQLFAPQVNKTFDSKEGATLTHNGASIAFGADLKYRDSDKKTYKGTVISKMSYYTINTQEGVAAFPGGYEGEDASEKFPLHVYSFMALSLTDDKGELLTLATNNNAVITFPATKLTNNNPTIPLWTYDDASGYWLEDTSTDVVNNTYVGKINVIGTYGLHTRAPAANLITCVNDASGLPISGADIRISATNWSANLAQTDADGELSLSNILAGANLSITASKTINGKTLTKKYPSTIILEEGETRDLVNCIELGFNVPSPSPSPRPSTDSNATDSNSTDSNTSK